MNIPILIRFLAEPFSFCLQQFHVKANSQLESWAVGAPNILRKVTRLVGVEKLLEAFYLLSLVATYKKNINYL